MTRTRTDAPWVALQIRPKMEKTVATHLAYRGYEHFLPLRRRGGAADQAGTETPVFPGYLFCRYSENAAGKNISTPGGTRILSFSGEPAGVRFPEGARAQTAIAFRLALGPLSSPAP